MGWNPLLWAKQTAKDRSGAATIEHLLNCFLQPNPSGSKQPFKILPIPGLKLWSNYGTGPIRGALEALGKWFVVSGNELYVVNSDKTSAMIGAIPGGGPVGMASNETHVGITTNLGFYWATIAAVGMVDGVHYSSISYQNGYAILTEFGSDRWYISGLDDMTTVSPLDYTNADALPDKVRGGTSLNGEVTMFGDRTIERYYLSGDPYFPFSRTPGGAIQVGCLGGDSITLTQNVVGWLADDFSARIISGGQQGIISTPGIEKWIKERLNPSSARGMAYRLEGHEVIIWNFQDGSIAYDLTTKLWHERQSFGKTRWRADCTCQAFGLQLVGDFENGNVYELDPNSVYEEVVSGVKTPVVRTMIPGPINAGPGRAFMSELMIDCEMGVGLGGAGVGSDPQWILDWSDDNGATWSNQITTSIGKAGEYANQARFNRLGQFIGSRSVRLTCSDPVRMAVLGAYWRPCDG